MSASEPKVQRFLAESELGIQHFGWEKFDELITSGNKIVNEGCESRHNLSILSRGTRWIQSYPCKKKTSQETEKDLRKFLEPSE